MKAALAVLSLVLLAVCAAPSAADARSKKKAAKPDGATLFRSNCAYCHGDTGRGDGQNAEKLDPKPADLTASDLAEDGVARVVRDGKGSCPSWRASLSAAEIAAVAKYAASLE